MVISIEGRKGGGTVGDLTVDDYTTLRDAGLLLNLKERALTLTQVLPLQDVRSETEFKMSLRDLKSQLFVVTALNIFSMDRFIYQIGIYQIGNYTRANGLSVLHTLFAISFPELHF